MVEDDNGAKPSANGTASIGIAVSLGEVEGDIEATEVTGKSCGVDDVIGIDVELNDVVMGEVGLGVGEMRPNVVNEVEVFVV